MKKIKFLIVSIITAFTACNKPPVDITGSWSRTSGDTTIDMFVSSPDSVVLSAYTEAGKAADMVFKFKGKYSQTGANSGVIEIEHIGKVPFVIENGQFVVTTMQNEKEIYSRKQ